jgi:hypothetical protein
MITAIAYVTFAALLGSILAEFVMRWVNEQQ